MLIPGEMVFFFTQKSRHLFNSNWICACPDEMRLSGYKPSIRAQFIQVIVGISTWVTINGQKL
jgi:hypothetical protein